MSFLLSLKLEIEKRAFQIPIMTNADDITASAHTHVGTPPPGYHQGGMKHTVHYHGFMSLPSTRNEFVDSPDFEGLGHQWRVSLYPGGRGDSAEGMVNLYLWNKSDKSIDIDFGFSVIDVNGKQVVSHRQTKLFAPIAPGGGVRWKDFKKRSNLLSSLVNGALVIEVQMRLAKPTKSNPPPFIPENPSTCKTIQDSFMDEKYSDILFEVGGDHRKDNAMKVAKTTPVTFPAHRLIVTNCSSILAELCESHTDDTTPIQINNVSPDIFRLLLSYMYGGKIPHDDMKSHVWDIIKAADKYGVINLKLEAEAYVVQTIIFTIENVKEILIYAESKNCALLKEAAMDYVVANKADVIKKLSFTDAPGTLLNDMLTAVVRNETEGAAPAGINENDLSFMRVSELRRKAHEKGLNVDGSREMLIAALKRGIM